MTPFVFWLLVAALCAAVLVFFLLWRRAARLVAAREALWRAAMQLLQNGSYSEVTALAQRSQWLLPTGASSEIGAALQAVACDVRQHATARRELEDVLSSLQDAVLVVDAEAHLRFLNAPALQMFGVRVEDVLGAQLLEALPSFGLDSCVRIALQEGRSTMREQSLYFTNATQTTAKRTGQIVDLQGENGESSTRNGSASHFTSPANGNARREVLMRVAPVRSSLGKVSGAVAILQDLTEVRRLERVRRDFVANASHELRTPIANIRAGAETVLSDPEDTQLAQRFLPQIVAESERLSRLVSDLLDLAHADAAIDTPLSPVDLREVVEIVVARLKEKAAQNNIAVYIEYSKEGGSGQVAGDFAGLEQVVFNLLDNALIYTPPGGTILLRVQAFDQPREVVFSISDTGLGIPPEDQERVFERFYRVDKARSRAQGGTGLGLAIVKNIVENHKGRIALQSTPGQGTTFTVRLPAL